PRDRRPRGDRRGGLLLALPARRCGGRLSVAPAASAADRPPRWALPAVLVLAAALFSWGLSWGLPSWRGWAGDELLPAVVLDGFARAFSGGWHTKYPPFHYYLLAAVEAPVAALARHGLLTLDPLALNTLLIRLGRLLSVLLSLATLALLARIGRQVSGARAGLFAALIAALSPPFVYFAKTANVEAP